MLSDHNPSDLMGERARLERDADEIAAMDARRTLLVQVISDEPLYKHNPLCSERNFRLLRIACPSDEPDVIECSVIEVDTATCPKFAALSYTWGSPFPPTAPLVEDAYQKSSRIRCNGRPLEVGQNLYDALRRLRGKVPEKPHSRLAPTALMIAAWNNVLVDVERLLRAGADIHARDAERRTALHHAARMGHLDIVKALVLSGSDVDATDKWGKTPIQLALEDARNINQPQWRDTEQFLFQQRGAVHGANTVLRSEATKLEYFWIDAVSERLLPQPQKMTNGLSRSVLTKQTIWKKHRKSLRWGTYIKPRSTSSFGSAESSMINMITRRTSYKDPGDYSMPEKQTKSLKRPWKN
jgi:hypothetical protein